LIDDIHTEFENLESVGRDQEMFVLMKAWFSGSKQTREA
jgi:hypothetical protein